MTFPTDWKIPVLRFWLFFGCALYLSPSWSQYIVTDLDADAQQLYDRLIVLSGGGPAQLHSAIKPYGRKDLVALADSVWLTCYSPIDRYRAQALWNRNNEFIRDAPLIADPLNGGSYSRDQKSKHPLWNTFYKTPDCAYEVDVPDFYLRINPVLHVAVGRENGEGVTTFINQRGMSLRGGIGQHVYFHTAFYDSQIRFPNYVNDFTDQNGVVPGAGLYKDFDSRFFDFRSGRDFLLANAYVGVDLGKYFGFQLGHNTCFLGDGIRSLFLSDFSTPYFSLKINTRIWKFHYQNIFAELAADDFRSSGGSADPIPKKYMAAHYLSFKPGPAISLGFFEAVVFDRKDHQFELQYLNPIIFYRTVEGSLGSPDNVLLGLNAHADLWSRVRCYGQFILDDISISRILDGHLDWWGNKFGHQLGIKYLNAGNVDQLDIQVEWNRVRPYTYSHYDSNANYSHYKQALAHPLGANFNEWIFSADYAASPKLSMTGRVYFIRQGEDKDSLSYGANILLPNTGRPGDFGHSIGQGVAADIVFWSGAVRYEITPGVYVDGQWIFRKKSSDLADRNRKTSLFQLGVRYNMPLRTDVF